jgi:NAD(P)-dependent dehydrogenase (short-subunit alcohol dehydrogenase family)
MFAATRADALRGPGESYSEEIKAEALESVWRIDTLRLFLAARQAIPAMRRKEKGAIIVVGATASRRGAAGAAAFAQAKVAQRALAESMARHL